MKIARIVSLLGTLAMTGVLIYGFTAGNFAQDGSKILANPWGIVSLVDLYVCFTLFSAWIVFRERSGISILWVILMMIFGALTASIYVLIALQTSQGDWARFFLGNRLEQVLTHHKKHLSKPSSSRR